VYFCIELLRAFEISRVRRRLFVEPTLLFEDGVRRSPDLLICATKQIIGAVEFKYTPRARPSTAKDLGTLVRIGDSTDDVVISNERFRGEGSPRHYSVAADAVLCWAAVHAAATIHLPDRALAKLGGRFLCLEAVTVKGAQARLRLNGKMRGRA
jgi:hypothetical protein